MRCLRCKEEFEEGFDVCWNCGADVEGQVDPGFKHADAPVKADRTTLRWFANGIGAFASLGGLFSVRVRKTASESAPWYRRDIIIPAWIKLGVAGLGLIAWGFFTSGTDSGRPLLFGFGGFLILAGAVCWFVVFKTRLDESEPGDLTELPSHIDPQALFDFIIEAKNGGVPDEVLGDQLSHAFELTTEVASDAVITVRAAVDVLSAGLKRNFSPDTKFELLVFETFESNIELLHNMAEAFDDD